MSSAVRLLWIAVGAAWFLWIGYEDRTLGFVMILGAGLCSAIALTWASRQFQEAALDGPRCLRVAALAGLGGGVLVGPMAVLLMLLKVSLHSHPVADFSLGDLGTALSRAPAWAAAGLMLGAGLGLLCWRAASPRPGSE